MKLLPLILLLLLCGCECGTTPDQADGVFVDDTVPACEPDQVAEPLQPVAVKPDHTVLAVNFPETEEQEFARFKEEWPNVYAKIMEPKCCPVPEPPKGLIDKPTEKKVTTKYQVILISQRGCGPCETLKYAALPGVRAAGYEIEESTDFARWGVSTTPYIVVFDPAANVFSKFDAVGMTTAEVLAGIERAKAKIEAPAETPQFDPRRLFRNR